MFLFDDRLLSRSFCLVAKTRNFDKKMHNFDKKMKKMHNFDKKKEKNAQLC